MPARDFLDDRRPIARVRGASADYGVLAVPFFGRMDGSPYFGGASRPAAYVPAYHRPATPGERPRQFSPVRLGRSI